MAAADPNEPVNRGTLDEAVTAILEGVGKMVDELRSEMNSRFGKVDDEMHNVKVELSHVKDEITGLKADLSDTPSRSEFEKLKASVEKQSALS